MLTPSRLWLLCVLGAALLPAPSTGSGIAITPDPPLPVAVAGTPYSVAFNASGGAGPYTWSLASGALPAGLQLDAATGILYGTPAGSGVFAVRLQATDTTNASTTEQLSITVKPPLAISTPSPLPEGTIRVGYSFNFSASGGSPDYTWSAGPGLPTGLTLNPATGVLSGIPDAAGSFTFQVQATDRAQFSVAKTFSTTVLAISQLGTSVGSLAFSAGEGGDSPLGQSFTVNSTRQSPVQFTVKVDGGNPNIPAPAWISFRPRTGITPARISVAVDSSALRAGKYSARVLVVSGDGSQTIGLPVTLTVDNGPPSLDVIPDYLRLTAPGQPTGAVEARLLIHNSGGGGPIHFQASVADSNPWLSVDPPSGTTSPGSHTMLRVIANPLVLRRDAYRGVVQITSDAGNMDVPVAFFLPDIGPALGLSKVGLRFDMRQGHAVSATQDIAVLNVGDSTVRWTAELVTRRRWLTLEATSGQATPGVPGFLPLSANPGNMAVGSYYALVRISDSHALNSPHYVTVVLNVLPATSPPVPDLSPPLLVFVSDAESSVNQQQALRLFASSSTPVSFQASAVTDDDAGWLKISPASGQTSASGTAQITVTANPANLKPDIYKADVTVELAGGSTRVVNVTLIVKPASPAASPKNTRLAGGCNPVRLSVTHGGLVNLFSTPASWPQPISVRVMDDCGNPVLNAQVVSAFSNGDAPLSLKLTDSQAAIYSGTWVPTIAASPVTVTARVAAPGFALAAEQLDGAVISNPAPTLKANGIKNTFNPVIAAPLAPGTLVRIEGSSFAPAGVEASPPLPTTLSGVTVLTGSLEAPLLSAGRDQIGAQLPAELAPARQYQVVVGAGAAFTVPDTIDVSAVDPGVSTSSSGQAVAQHADGSQVTETAPAQPGELITIFLAGLGATDLTVESGQPSPDNPPASVLAQPLATLGGEQADVISAGLSPGVVGLYSLLFRVPADAPAGDLALQITQNGIPANSATISVGAGAP